LDTNDVEHPGSYGGKVPLDEDIKDVYDADSKSVDECCELEQLVLAIVVDHAENEEHDKDQSIDDGWPGDSHDEKSEKHNLVDVNNQYVKALVKELDHGSKALPHPYLILPLVVLSLVGSGLLARCFCFLFPRLFWKPVFVEMTGRVRFWIT
jgi:hypothetical protein